MAAIKAVFFLQIILFPVIRASRVPKIHREVVFPDRELSDAADGRQALREKLDQIMGLLDEVPALTEICEACDYNPCLNGGTWYQDVGGDYCCECPVGWMGDRCEEKSTCHSNPCLNGGNCTNEVVVNYNCQCVGGFMGDTCQEKPCDSNPCLNGGNCTNEAAGNYSCQCANGWLGDRCQEKPCDSNPCLNGGSCTNQAGGKYICHCAIGWVGESCQDKPCDSNPCLNGGNCTNEARGGYSCQCAIGWRGDICQEVSACDSHPCLNGGNCTNEEECDYSCQCAVGWLGDRCQFDVSASKGLEDSIIVNNSATQLGKLSEWLKPVAQSGHQWKLCWRATKDGWGGSTFHSKCDYKGPTVIIIHVGKYIFGGYVSVSWVTGGSYQSDPKAFLFSLVNNPGWDPLKLPQQGEQDTSYSYSIFDDSNCRPVFGGGHDVQIYSDAISNLNSYSNLGYSYSPPRGHSYGSTFAQTFLAGRYNFSPDEVEVFYESA